MFVEIHIIQNFAPANLNRDDTGSPKNCQFGGHLRARVSSQCWKRAVREYFAEEALIPPSELAIRTKRLAGLIAGNLIARDSSRTADQALEVAAVAVEAIGTKLDGKVKDDKRTSVVLFVGTDQVDRLSNICDEHWEALASGLTKRKSEVPKEITKTLREAFKGSRAVDLALFGRMIAEDPDKSVDAACQVAHAISTHRVASEFDYYTAVDDFGRGDGAGAGMIGTQDFVSACLYRYANISLEQLVTNLQGDRQLALLGLLAFLRSFVMAIPKAKQSGTAAQSLPSFAMVVVRDKGLASLVNAFAKPVDGRDGGLILNSIAALAKHYGKVLEMYGADGIRATQFAAEEDLGIQSLLEAGARRVRSVSELLDRTMATVVETQP